MRIASSIGCPIRGSKLRGYFIFRCVLQFTDLASIFYLFPPGTVGFLNHLPGPPANVPFAPQLWWRLAIVAIVAIVAIAAIVAIVAIARNS